METAPMAKQRILWLDCAKFVAMIAVVTDHVYGAAYTNPMIAHASFFSVSLFVLLSGVSAWLSLGTRQAPLFPVQLRRIGKLALQYALAVFVVYCLRYRGFDLTQYLDMLLHFSISAEYYFFVFFFQLLLIAPALIYWCRFCNRQKAALLWQGATLVVLCVAAWLFIKRSFILPVHGGGQHLFGGTYIILFYLGMLMASRNVFARTRKQRCVILIVSACLWIGWWQLMGKEILPFDNLLFSVWGGGFNPPSGNFMGFSIITLLLLYAAFSLLEEHPFMRKILHPLSVMGQCTLYIFLYHMVVQRVMIALIPAVEANMWLYRFLVVIPMLLLPVLSVLLCRYLYQKICTGAAGKK